MTTAMAARQRVDSVDFLRGIAMMGLVLVHSVLYLSPLPEDVDVVYLMFAFVLGDVGAALFLTLVGISFVLSRASTLPGPAVVVGAAIRGAFLIVVAMLVSLFTTGVQSLFEWDVLALIGIASVVLALLRSAPSWVLLVVAALVVAVAPVLREAVDYLQWWGGGLAPVDGLEPEGLLVHPLADYVPGLDPTTALVGILVAGWFPMFPWLAFPIAGMVLGRHMAGDRVRTAGWWVLAGVVGMASGLGLAVAAVTRGRSDPVTEHVTALSFMPNSTSMVVFQAGLVLLVLGLTHLFMDGGRPVGRWLDPFRLVSRYALTVYVLSYVAIFAVIHILDLVDTRWPHEYAVTTSGWALVFGIVLVAVALPLLRLWDRHGGVLSLEWVLARLRSR